MLNVIEGKEAYPYITKFKKEPFKSFAFIKKREIGSFYLSENEKVLEFYQYFNNNILSDKSLNLENVYWFLLLRKYLKKDKKENADKIFNFIKSCEIISGNKIGFKFSPNSNQIEPDIWSTFFALSSMKLLGYLKEYLFSPENNNIKREIKNLILAHQKGNIFLHCLNNECEICKKTSPAHTIYYALEILRILGIDTRLSKDIFRQSLSDRKRDPSLVFKLLSLRFLDLELDVRERSIQYIQEAQKENGGFSFKKIIGKINTTFWVGYTLDIYSWLLDYNPVGIYSFIISCIKDILSDDINQNLIKLMEFTKLVILLSIIWKKFIEEIERLIFKQLEREKYIDFNKIKTNFGLNYGINDIISYINRNYTFNLKILDNKIEFRNYSQNLSEGKKIFAEELYNQVSKNNVVSISGILKKYKASFASEHLKIREDIFPLINGMMNRNFFKGQIIKKGFLKKFFFHSNSFVQNPIVSDTEINFSQLLKEKEVLKEIKNDIFNMTLKLKNITTHIKEEIESYLILDELSLAKERLKYVIRNALMEADFLNENIENSFNEELYFVNIHVIFKSEISHWHELYNILSKKIKVINLDLREKISSKEKIRDLDQTLENLEEKIFIFNDSIIRKINEFRNNYGEAFKNKCSDEKLDLITKEVLTIKNNVSNFDKKIYEISQKIDSKEDLIIKKRNKVINKWITLNEELNNTFNFYIDGFTFFKKNMSFLDNLKQNFIQKSNHISEKAKTKTKINQFKEAFNIIKRESDELLKEKTIEIKKIQEIVKNEISSNQKLYLLYRHLQEKIDVVEEDLVTVTADQVQSLKNKVIEGRNRSKIEDFDNFVSKQISNFKSELNNYKQKLESSHNIVIKDVSKGFDLIQNKFEEVHIQFLKKLTKCKELVSQFHEKSDVTIIQWENFKEYFNNELNVLKDEFTNNIIFDKINLISNEKRTNSVKIVDLKRDLGLKCGVLMERINKMIEISKLNAELYEAEKTILIYTEHFYKNKELKNFVDNKILKLTRETVGKSLALYDSSIRNSTLAVNILELQNRISEINFEQLIREQFNSKVKELIIDKTRQEHHETRAYFESVIENNKLAIESIENNINIFINKQNFINQEFNALNSELYLKYSQTFEDIDKSHEKAYIKVKENFENNWKKLSLKFKEICLIIEEDVESSINQNPASHKLGPEIGEFFVTKKNEFLKEYEQKKEKINAEIIILKDDAFRNKLIDVVDEHKINMSQMLGTLQTKVEDDVETKEFKRAYIKIQKRAKNIEDRIRFINKNIKSLVKKLNKESVNFKTKNRYILDDFQKFTDEYYETLTEKIKSLEHLIVKEYIKMAIKAVSNEYLTISFLNHELKIKKNNLQDAILNLISTGRLDGKYDPRLGLYYENPEVLKNLDEEELEVIKKMNFRVYMAIRRFKNFAKQYTSIIALFAAVLSLTYTFYQLTNGNPFVFALPPIVFLALMFFLVKKSKEEKVKI